MRAKPASFAGYLGAPRCVTRVLPVQSREKAHYRTRPSLQSIQEVFGHPLFTGVSRLIVFRCKRDAGDETYSRNVRWLKEGRTGYWPVHHAQEFGGVVVLLDANKRVEVWAGRSFGTNSGRVEQRKDDKRWTLQVEGAFEFIGWMEQPVTAFIGREAIGNTTNYVDFDRSANLRAPKAPAPGMKPTGRGFNPEFAGDRATATPGSYTPTSVHCQVVNAMHAWLVSRGYKNLDNKSGLHDMHGQNAEGHWELFEVKSAANTTSIYTALGQLQLYGLRTGPSRKIAVLPHKRDVVADWGGKLAQLDVSLVTFIKNDAGFTFTEH